MRHPFIVSALAAALALAVDTSALAEPTLGEDLVELQDGGSMRCTVVEVAPGTSVKVVAFGETDAKTLPWSAVKSVERGKFTADPAPKPPAPEAAQAPVAGDPGVVRVHVDGPAGVQIFQHGAPQLVSIGPRRQLLDTAHLVCEAPCDALVNVGTGQFTATGAFPSIDFSVGAASDDVDVQVSPGSTAARSGGIALMAIGPGIMVAGALTLGVGATLPRWCDAPGSFAGGSCVHTDPQAVLVGGGVTLALGAALFVTGTVLFGTSGSSVTVEPHKAGARHTAVEPVWWKGEF